MPTMKQGTTCEKNVTKMILFGKLFAHEIDACHCVGNKQNELLRKLSRKLCADFPWNFCEDFHLRKRLEKFVRVSCTQNRTQYT